MSPPGSDARERGAPHDLRPAITALGVTPPPSIGARPSRVLTFLDDGVPSDLRPTIDETLARWFPAVPGATHVVRGGESAKTIAAWTSLLEACRDEGLDRDALLVVIGGGALGDAVGFCASTWHRGIRWIALPTTLLAMVDAHLGGKTALDLGALKNPLGSFWWPEAIVADRAFLDSLPVRERRSGWAEMLKAAWIGDAALFETWESDPPCESDRVDEFGRPCLRLPTGDEIERTVAVKRAVVSVDPKEGDRRRVLNLGHTLGHALETLPAANRFDDPAGLAHGEAVATGMAFAAGLALARPGANDEPRRLIALLERLGYSVTWPGEATEELLSRIASDKKGRGGEVVCVLPIAPGRVELVPHATETLRRSLRAGYVEA